MCGVGTGNIVRYDSHKLYEIRLKRAVPLRIKRAIDRHIVLDDDTDSLTVLVEPQEASKFDTLLKDNGISHDILVRLML